MRPDRSVVKKAIQDAGGNLSRAAILLGCTRPTLYTWIYQHGLQKLAGIRLDRELPLYRRQCKDAHVGMPNESGRSGVKSAQPNRPILRAVEARVATDPVIPATVKVHESIWKRLKIQAIEEDTTMGAIVERALELVLAPRATKRVSRSSGETE